MTTTLKAHPIWQNLSQALAQIDLNQIARQHLQDCKFEIHGYWDENDQPYETIRFKQTPTPQLISSSIGVTPNQTGKYLLAATQICAQYFPICNRWRVALDFE
ncbi:MAG: hypothetical protein HC840_17115 [Leptolyngbyaceae cyanobacterium RM2_2_4]|nr:hypothetical protein [Leptolyngbyaceae cyanobacterium RM2_2_4]